jgi:hypothetical protein
MRKEIRRLFAILLIRLTLKVLPNGEFKSKFMLFILNDIKTL